MKIAAYLLFILLISQINTKAEDIQNIKRENIGKPVNSEYDELMPILTSDGKTLYFSRKKIPANYGYEKKDDIWYSTLQADGSWSNPKNIGPPLNNDYSNAVVSVSADGNTLLVGGEYIINGELKNGVFISERTSNGWTNPKQIDIRDFYNDSKFVSFCLSNDGQTLLMSVQRADSKGGLDIYVTFMMPDDIWCRPINLGKDINTEFDENTPFIAADGSSLYFSSKGHGSIGDYDVFVSRRLDDTWTKWSKPENLGTVINTAGGDANYIITSSGEYAYFASTENTIGGWDIFRIKIPEKLKPKPVVLITGKITNKMTGQPIDAKVYYQSLPTAKEMGVGRTNPKTGYYALTMPAGYVYRFIVDGKDFVSISKDIDMENYNEYTEITQDFELVLADSLIQIIREIDMKKVNKETEIPDFLDELPENILQVEIFDKIFLYFPYNEYPLNSEYFPQLDYVANILNRYKDFKLIIVGHTDSLGTPLYNMKLSERRAKSATDYLNSKGIARNRITFRGEGMSKPVAANDTEIGRAKNRRVVFYILKK